MSKVRVYEVARQLNMDQKALVALFQSMGLTDVKNHMSAVEPDAVDRVKRQLDKGKAPAVVEERIRPTVVKRKAVPRPGVPEAPSSREVAAPPEAAPSREVRESRDVREIAPPQAAPPSVAAPTPPPSVAFGATWQNAPSTTSWSTTAP